MIGEKFILGICKCGCQEEIPVRSSRRTLQFFKNGHTFKNKVPPGYKGGRVVEPKRKYIKILSKGHPHADLDGYVFEHRLVMEAHLGRYLEPCEVVHHIDKNRQNNALNNLLLTTRKLHPVEHRTDMSDRFCSNCGSKTTWKRSCNGRPTWRKVGDGYYCANCYQNKNRKSRVKT